MENNPYRSDYHDYLENLKKKLDNADSYVNSNVNHGLDNYFENKNTDSVPDVYTKKNIDIYKYFSIFSILIIIILLFFSFTNKNNNLNVKADNNENIQTGQQSVEDELRKLYVRADITRNIFATSTEVDISTSTISENKKKNNMDISKYFNIDIPGISRIGYDENLGNEFLTDNINKYSDKTLVIGDRTDIAENQIVGSDDSSISFDQYDITPKAVIPVLNSKAYMMADLETGEVIIEKNSDTIYPLASVSKLMTAVVATEKMNLNDIAIVSNDASNAYGAQGSLKLGEKIILSDLIYPLLMESSNDAAEVFADHYGHQAFMDEMNKKAKSLEMYDTYYGDPSGLDPKNTSTPNDLLKLVQYIWRNDPSIFATTRVKQFSIKNHTWYNRNPQLPLSGFVGGKNGYIDQALQTTASIFEIPTLKGGNRKVVIIILKSADKNGDVNKLIKFLKSAVVYTP